VVTHSPYQSTIRSHSLCVHLERCGLTVLQGHNNDARLTSDVCLSRTSGLSREQLSLGRLKLAQRLPTSHVTRTTFSRSKGQRSTCRGRGHIVAVSRTTCYCSSRNRTSCRRATATICPLPCTPRAAAQLQPIHALRLACGAQRALLSVAVGAMNIHDVRDRRRQTDVRRQTASSLSLGV